MRACLARQSLAQQPASVRLGGGLAAAWRPAREQSIAQFARQAELQTAGVDAGFRWGKGIVIWCSHAGRPRF